MINDENDVYAEINPANDSCKAKYVEMTPESVHTRKNACYEYTENFYEDII